MKKKSFATDVIMFLLCVFFTVGTTLIFKGCAVHEDGVSACYDEWRILIGLGGVLIVESLLHIAFRKPEIKQGVSLAMIPTALFAPVIACQLGSLCMMPDMSCNEVMKPAAVSLGIVIAAFAAVDFTVQLIASRKAGKDA